MSGSNPGSSKNGTNSKRKVLVDVANLRQPISTTITGMKQAISVLNSGSVEAKNALLHESNVIYECKVCLSMFRSIANLVAHKRSFCRLKSGAALHVYPDKNDVKENEETIVIVEQELPATANNSDTWNMDNYSPSMELIKTAGLLEDLLAAKFTPDQLNPNKSILAVTKKLKTMADVASKETVSTLRCDNRAINSNEAQQRPARIVLEPVFNTNNAVFQSWKVTEGEPTQKDLNSELNSFRDNINNVIIKGDSSCYEKCDDAPLERRFPCCFCDSNYGIFFSLKRHYEKHHAEKHGDFSLHRDKLLKIAYYKDVSSEVSNRDNLPLRSPIKPLKVNVSRKNITQEHLDDIENEKHVDIIPEEIIPSQVQEKIMESVDRRNVQCKQCFKKFRTSKLVQQHVANHHLQFKRFKCTLCDYGAWVRDHVVKHVENNHRKSSKDVIIEQPFEKYFVLPTPTNSPKKNGQKGVKTPQKCFEVRLSPAKMLHDNLISLDKKEKSPSNCSGYDSDNELVPTSVLTGLQNQIRISIEEDAKPISPEPEVIIKPQVNRGPRGRPMGSTKRKRDTSENSCDSNNQPERILQNGDGVNGSPQLLLDTRGTQAKRSRSPAKAMLELHEVKKIKKSARSKAKGPPENKEANVHKVRRSFSK